MQSQDLPLLRMRQDYSRSNKDPELEDDNKPSSLLRRWTLTSLSQVLSLGHQDLPSMERPPCLPVTVLQPLTAQVHAVLGLLLRDMETTRWSVGSSNFIILGVKQNHTLAQCKPFSPLKKIKEARISQRMLVSKCRCFTKPNNCLQCNNHFH